MMFQHPSGAAMSRADMWRRVRYALANLRRAEHGWASDSDALRVTAACWLGRLGHYRLAWRVLEWQPPAKPDARPWLDGVERF